MPELSEDGLTSPAPRRVMVSLSVWFPRLARLVSIASALTVAGPALAQLPAYVAPDAPPAPSPAPPASEPTAPVESAAATPRKAPPAATSGAPLSAPPAAKTAVITENHAAVEPRPDADDDAVEAPTGPRWYGWQTLTADGATLALLIAASAVSQGRDGEHLAPPMLVLGMASYELTPGIIHFAHRNPGRGFASFGIRFGLPLAGAFIGASAASGCNGFFCEAGGAAVGLLLGAGGAIAIDAAVFAYDDPGRRSTRRKSFIPLVAVTPQRAIIGLAGEL